MRHVHHVVISVLAWCLFGYHWWIVAQRHMNPTTFVAMKTLGALVLSGLVLTLLWVIHNLRLAKSYGRRRGFTPPPEPFAMDTLERPLVAPELPVLRAAQLVEISLDDAGNKVYIAGGEVQG